MKRFLSIFIFSVVFSGLVFAGDGKPKQKLLFDLLGLKSKTDLKPTSVSSNLIEFDVEGVRLKVYYTPATGKITIKEIRNSQIHDPQQSLSDDLRKRVARKAAAIFTDQRKRSRRSRGGVFESFKKGVEGEGRVK